ncbi:transcription termination factor Rho [uncultured Pseudokineococcus sp.]|uniref:transcription termination factor Rho n=1 Tax=uncultured Pseudokineococcus sp. TaxID=1642928 RepID=UPI002639DB5B|nr:transcription termination factor Rho [uncultured Pseudokineococcus sp.]
MTDTTDIAQPAAEAEGGGTARRAPLSQLRLGQLQELATSLGVQGTATMRKSDLLAAIRAEQGGSARGRRDGGSAPAGEAPAAPAPEAQQPPQPRRSDDDAPAAQVTEAGPRRSRRAVRAAGAPDARSDSGATGAVPAEAAPARTAPQDGAEQARPEPNGSERNGSGRSGSDQDGSARVAADQVGSAQDGSGRSSSGQDGSAPERDEQPRAEQGRQGRRERQESRRQEQDQRRQERGDRDQGRADQGRTEQGDPQQGRQEQQDPSDGRLDPRAQLEQSLDLRERARHRRGEGAGQDEERGERGQRSRDDRPDRGDDRGDRSDRGPGQQDRGQGGQQDDDEDGGGRRGRRGRYRDRKRRGRTDGAPSTGQGPEVEPDVSDDDVLVNVAGVLDVLDSYAFVRTSGYLPGPHDVYVTLAQVKKHGMRKGDVVTGAIKARSDNDGDGQDAPGGSGRGGRQQRQQRAQKFTPLVRVDTVNGLGPDEARRRPDFSKLTPLYPQDRLRLETDRGQYTQRVIDLVAPIGKGQRGLIVAPPKAGKTIVMQQIANAITRNNPDVHLMVVLVDERPEEVTDMQRTVKGEVIASTFDRPAEDHTTVAELAIERAKRLVEMGHDVVVLLDSLTRLSRAYNTSAPASGRILSGGIDASALYPPKRFFGAARNIENGGSLTILASALVETGSKADEVIFEEFKGTGNMELRLARHLADKRIFPAVDVNASGTRREEILMSPEELKVVYKLRRVLGALDSTQAIELVLGKLRETGSNAEFLMQVQRTAPAGPGGDQRSELSPSS